MAKIIKQVKKAERVFKVDDIVQWSDSFHDGRSYEVTHYAGKIIKICPVNLHVKDENGNIWSVGKNEIR